MRSSRLSAFNKNIIGLDITFNRRSLWQKTAIGCCSASYPKWNFEVLCGPLLLQLSDSRLMSFQPSSPTHVKLVLMATEYVLSTAPKLLAGHEK